MNRVKPTVGQILYRLNIGNDARSRRQELSPCTVTRVGKKYFYVKGDFSYGREVSFCLEDWQENTNYCKNSRLYEFIEEWEAEKTEADICLHISRAFEYGRNNKGFSLAALRRIASVMGYEP